MKDPELTKSITNFNLVYFINKNILRLWAKKRALVNRKAQSAPKLARLPMGPLIGPNAAYQKSEISRFPHK